MECERRTNTGDASSLTALEPLRYVHAAGGDVTPQIAE
jgi:hypothetical protein